MLRSQRDSRWPDPDPSTEGCANHHCTWTVKGARHNRYELHRIQRCREAHPPIRPVRLSLALIFRSLPVATAGNAVHQRRQLHLSTD